MNETLSVERKSNITDEQQLIAKEMQSNDYLVLVCNCLNCPTKPLCYTNVRTVFDVKERSSQLKRTFLSIRKYLPKSRIHWLESSVLNDEQTKEFTEFCSEHNIFCNSFSHHKDVSLQNESPFKGPTELLMIELFLKSHLASYKYSPRYIIKISGRYELNDNFLSVSNFDRKDFLLEKEYIVDVLRFMSFSSERYTVKAFDNGSVTTTLYVVPKHLFADYQNRLRKTIETCKSQPIGIEYELFRDCEQLKKVEKIGVEGRVSVDGSFFCC